MHESDEVIKLDLEPGYAPAGPGLNLVPEWQQLLRDEIVPMTEEDRKFLQGKVYGSGCLSIPAFLAVAVCAFIMASNTPTLYWRLTFCGIAIVLAAFVYMILRVLNSTTRQQLADNKKRVIVTTVEKLPITTRTNGPMTFYAEIKLRPNNAKIEIDKKLSSSLQIGSLVEVHATPETEYLGTIIRGLIEVGNAPKEESKANQ